MVAALTAERGRECLISTNSSSSDPDRPGSPRPSTPGGPTSQPIVVEGIGAGGQLMLTTDVENFPGFPDGILGPELMMKFREQAERFGAEFVTADADSVDLAPGGPFGVRVGEREIRAQVDDHHHRRARPACSASPPSSSCSATACPPAPPATASSSARSRSRSSAAATPRSRKRSSSPSSPPPSPSSTGATSCGRRRSCRTARSPTRRSSSSGTPRSSDVVGNGAVEAVHLRDTVTGDESELAVQGLFVAIGHDPNTSLFAGQLDLDENGYIVTAGRLHAHLGRRRVRGRRRAGPRVPPGDHRRGLGLHGRDRGRALARRARARRLTGAHRPTPKSDLAVGE